MNPTAAEMVKGMHQEFGEFYYDRRDLHLDVARGLSLVANLAATPPARVGEFDVQQVADTDGTKLLFADESWLLFRQSGTEPMLRIYSEATSIAKMNMLLKAGQQLAQNG